MIELAELPLVLSSEKIETVSISGYHKVTSQGSDTVLSKYRKRPPHLAHLSLHEFFHHLRNSNSNTRQVVVPHYVGGRSTPVYPPTSSYARAVLLIHKPWSESDKLVNDTEWVRQFYQFMTSDKCPNSVRVAYQRVKSRYLNKLQFKEPTAGGESFNDNGFVELDKDTQDLVDHFSTLNSNLSSQVFMQGLSVNRGIDCNWGQRVNEVRTDIRRGKQNV